VRDALGLFFSTPAAPRLNYKSLISLRFERGAIAFPPDRWKDGLFFCRSTTLRPSQLAPLFRLSPPTSSLHPSVLLAFHGHFFLSLLFPVILPSPFPPFVLREERSCTTFASFLSALCKQCVYSLLPEPTPCGGAESGFLSFSLPGGLPKRSDIPVPEFPLPHVDQSEN